MVWILGNLRVVIGPWRHFLRLFGLPLPRVVDLTTPAHRAKWVSHALKRCGASL